MLYNYFVEIKGKIAIVTGASSGIGLATAKLLTKKGAKVALVARSKDKLEKISAELPGSKAFVADMSREEDVRSMIKKAVERFGRINILVNNAGRGYDSMVEGIKPELFRNLFDLDLLGPLVAMQEVIPMMKKQGGGSIINISSGTALMFLPGMSAYSSLKRALVGISLTAREELKDDKINVSVIYPYITKTDFEKNTLKENSPNDNEEEFESFMPEGDTAEYVAEKIVEAIEKEKAEVFAHDWMKKALPQGV